jgi:hypothetical protein
MPAPTAAQRPLEHYWIASAAQLPAPDALGFRTFKGRQYVDVPGGGVVHIEADPDTGLYRAKLRSELQASGPVLMRDPESTLWHPVEEVGSTTYPLTATRLEAFRTNLDFTGVEPGSDRLYRRKGKLYVVIEDRAYQVLRDLEASSPQTPVMRIVRAEDPVALGNRNVYVAKRSGRTEPVVYDALDGWVGTKVGAGGMKLGPDIPIYRQINQQEADLYATHNAIAAADARRLQLDTKWQESKGTEGERVALALLEVQISQLLTLVEAQEARLVSGRNWIVLLKSDDAYKNELHETRKFAVALYCHLIVAKDQRKTLEFRSNNDPVAAYGALANHMVRKRDILEKCHRVASEIRKNARSAELELAELGFDPIEIHEVVAGWVEARSRLMTNDPSDSDSEAVQLAHSFVEATCALRGIESIPKVARIAALTGLVDQSAAIRDSYEHLDLPPGQDSSRRDIIHAIESYENILERQIARYYRNSKNISALPAQDQPIDFDFVPAQARPGPAPMPRRMIRAKHHGVYKISVGQSRRTATGEELIDVIDPNNSAQVLRTYERREEEWRQVRTVQNTALPELMTQATQQLNQFDLHLNEARRDERAKRNASNIVEYLGGKAAKLDELILQFERTPNPTGENIDGLVQRLRHDSQRLRTEGEDIRIRLYKEKNFLAGDRLAYLISQEHISAVKILDRELRGKGQEKHFLDIYSLNDRHTREPLWHAHFHYDQKDTPALLFNVKGGHLKTLEQSGKGISSQRRDEQAGRPHNAIWRPGIDSRTAQRIFDLAT